LNSARDNFTQPIDTSAPDSRSCNYRPVKHQSNEIFYIRLNLIEFAKSLFSLQARATFGVTTCRRMSHLSYMVRQIMPNPKPVCINRATALFRIFGSCDKSSLVYIKICSGLHNIKGLVEKRHCSFIDTLISDVRFSNLLLVYGSIALYRL